MIAQSRFAASDWLAVFSRHLTSVAMILSVISVRRFGAAVGDCRSRRERRNGEILPRLEGSSMSDWCWSFWANSDTLSFVPLPSPIAPIAFLAARKYFFRVSGLRPSNARSNLASGSISFVIEGLEGNNLQAFSTPVALFPCSPKRLGPRTSTRRVPLFRRSVPPSLGQSVPCTQAKARAPQFGPESGTASVPKHYKVVPLTGACEAVCGNQHFWHRAHASALLNMVLCLATLTVVDVRHSLVLRLTQSLVLRKQVRW
jgi:hypothetical protein